VSSHPVEAFLDYMKAETIRRNAANRTEGLPGVMTLGELTAALENVDPTLPIILDEGGSPGDFESYRGYYDHLAIEPGGGPVPVGDFLHRCREAKGATFTGYKGGEYVMGDDTPVWVSEYGHASEVGLTGVSVGDLEVLLITDQEVEL
jgi:hypothetical protein